jgi:hypothetical protein
MPAGLLCAMGSGCYGNEIFHVYTRIIIETWPRLLLFLMPLVIFGGAVFLSLKEGKSEK